MPVVWTVSATKGCAATASACAISCALGSRWLCAGSCSVEAGVLAAEFCVCGPGLGGCACGLGPGFGAEARPGVRGWPVASAAGEGAGAESGPGVMLILISVVPRPRETAQRASV